MTKDELAELRMYTYGTLKATCGAMESLSESVGVAHDSLCVWEALDTLFKIGQFLVFIMAQTLLWNFNCILSNGHV